MVKDMSFTPVIHMCSQLDLVNADRLWLWSYY